MSVCCSTYLEPAGCAIISVALYRWCMVWVCAGIAERIHTASAPAPLLVPSIGEVSMSSLQCVLGRRCCFCCWMQSQQRPVRVDSSQSTIGPTLKKRNDLSDIMNLSSADWPSACNRFQCQRIRDTDRC